MDYALLYAGFVTTPVRQGHADAAQRRLHACLRQAVLQGQLSAGTQLPASRVLAAELGLARNTVIHAYNQLATEGLVHTNRRGTWVQAVGTAPLPRPARAALRQDLSQRALQQHPLPLATELAGAFAPGVPSLAEFPQAAWRRLQDRVWRELGPEPLGYGQACGDPHLREAVAEHLRTTRGLRCEAGQVFITDGTQSGLGLCAHAFADPGDTVWMENPGYGGALSALRNAQLQVRGIAVDDEGLAPTAADWAQAPPRLIYITPAHQYPTGGVLGLPRRTALLQQAQHHGAWLIEDDYDSEFRHDGPPLPAMQGLRPDAPVLYLGTFSKSLFPALRLGYLVVPATVADRLAHYIEHSRYLGRAPEQRVMAEFLRSGLFSQHLRRMRRVYRQRGQWLAQALNTQLGDLAQVHGAQAGMHLALRFRHPGWDDQALTRQLLRQGLAAPALSAHRTDLWTPGAPAQADWCGLVLGYAQVPEPALHAGVSTLCRVLRQHVPA